MKHHESKLQQACVRYFRLQYPKAMIVAIPNGGKRSRVEAAIMQAEGVTAGFPDLMIIVPNNIFFIEMKYGSNTTTAIQKEVHIRLNALNQRVYTCNSFEEFETVVKQEQSKQLQLL